MLFLGHKLATTNGRKPIKGSKDACFRLVFFKKKTMVIVGSINSRSI